VSLGAGELKKVLIGDVDSYEIHGLSRQKWLIQTRSSTFKNYDELSRAWQSSRDQF
jgi:hypothetical protein